MKLLYDMQLRYRWLNFFNISKHKLPLIRQLQIKIKEKLHTRLILEANVMPKKIILVDTLAFLISTIGILASLYAGCLNAELRTTCSTLVAVNLVISLILLD